MSGNDQRAIDPTGHFGGAFLLADAPDGDLPEGGMKPQEAMRLITDDLVLDGIPERNLATFVTTWMEPEAQQIIAENLHRNFIDTPSTRRPPRSSSAA